MNVSEGKGGQASAADPGRQGTKSRMSIKSELHQEGEITETSTLGTYRSDLSTVPQTENRV